jgi:hypothetical protein
MMYDVFTDDDIDQLKDRVSSAISQGFTPAGGISITEVHVDKDEPSDKMNIATRLLYAQAVYKLTGPL